MSKIKRRDFINGTLMAAGVAMLPVGCDNNTVLDHIDPLYYCLLYTSDAADE